MSENMSYNFHKMEQDDQNEWFLVRKCNVIFRCVTKLCDSMRSIGNSFLHPRLAKVLSKHCLIDHSKFLIGIISSVGWIPVSAETENGSEP